MQNEADVFTKAVVTYLDQRRMQKHLERENKQVIILQWIWNVCKFVTMFRAQPMPVVFFIQSQTWLISIIGL